MARTNAKHTIFVVLFKNKRKQMSKRTLQLLDEIIAFVEHATQKVEDEHEYLDTSSSSDDYPSDPQLQPVLFRGRWRTRRFVNFILRRRGMRYVRDRMCDIRKHHSKYK